MHTKFISRFRSFSFLRTCPAFTFFFLIILTGCGSASGTQAQGGQVTITGKIASCAGNGDSIRVFQLIGQELKPIAAAVLTQAGTDQTFKMEVKVPQSGLYVIGPNPQQNQAVLMVLGPEKEVVLNATCPNFFQSAIMPGSASNDAYKKVMAKISAYQQSSNALAQNRQLFAQSDPTQVARIQTQMDDEFTKFSTYLDSVTKAGGVIGNLARLYNCNFFPSPATCNGKSELDYFLNTYWEKVDLAQPEIAYLNIYFEKGKNYAAAIGAQNVPDGLNRLNTLADKTPAGSENRKVLLLAFMNGAEQAKSDDIYLAIANRFLKEFPNEKERNAALAERVKQMAMFAVGAPAPEIELMTPEGTMLKLSDLKGKVVMIDFWASWCRPCRAENPNVVRAYAKYKSAGFEIYGVSLDDKKPNWLDAIAKDGLTWKHVSDLAGWKSAGAKTYNVQSIPATFLIDKEGKILARNLRGAALDAKLSQIFGF
jgi:peroxiredoxin